MALQKLEFRIDIAAPKQKVWQTLWQDNTYRLWTRVFSDGSYAVSDWKEGSPVMFLNPEGSGLYSRIEQMVPGEKMFFTHLGAVKDGKEMPETPETRSWAGAQENYSLIGHGDSTQLVVSIDVSEGHLDYFRETFPKALEQVKALAEQG